jgi:hypothetical protein
MPNGNPTPETEQKPKRKYRKKLRRTFNETDSDFIQANHNLHKHFTDRIADFTAFDPVFDIAFATAWLEKIKECEEFPADDNNIGEQLIEKRKLTEALKPLIKKINDLEYYVTKAFPDDDEILYEFGFADVARPEQYSLQFIVNCMVIRMLADIHYQTQLLNVGMPLSLLQDLEDLIGEVAGHEMNHEMAKRVRIQRARNKIINLNKLHSFANTVKRAAKTIYYYNPEVAGVFG